MIIKSYKDRKSMKVACPLCPTVPFLKSYCFGILHSVGHWSVRGNLRARVALIASLELRSSCHAALLVVHSIRVWQQWQDRGWVWHTTALQRMLGDSSHSLPRLQQLHPFIGECLTQPGAARVTTGKGMGEVWSITKIPPHHCSNSSKQQQQAVKSEALTHTHART